MHITVLGGAGKMGCISVQDLANDQRVDKVTIADTNMEQARIVADYLNTPKIDIKLVDPHDPEGFVKALEGSDAVINATIRHTNLAVMEACLKAGAHYTDMGGLFFVTREQLKLHERFAQAGLSAALGLGSAPGIPNIQARYAADRLDSIESIKIYDGIKPPAPDDINFTYSVPTIVDELTLEPMVYQDGEFQARPPLTGFEDYWFTPPLGLLPMHLSLHSEVATLPLTFKDKGVKECFFKINYWGMAKETVDKIRVLADFGFGSYDPVEVNGQNVTPRDLMVRLLSEYVPPITTFLAPPTRRPPDWVKEIVTEVKGIKDGKDITYRLGTLTVKGALPTGAAPALAAIWLASGRIPPGVYAPEAAFEPEPFFKELETRGILTQVSVTSML
ncbi:MAG: saccharopine dehydrogenase NADP-binding domain-containing protein [Anaerolineales bacterium]|nr:saccharopine dehydrogenase NADP-binding domain-containing protein [Anaerolineales bacterium]